MISSQSQSVPLLAILASSLTLTCLSLIRSTLSLQILSFPHSGHPSNSSSFSSFCSHLQIHLSPANLTTAIQFTRASHKQISTNFNAFKTHWHASSQTLQNTNTYITPALKNLHWLPIKQRIEYKLCLLTYKTLTNQQPTYLYNSLSFLSHSVSTRSSDSLVFFIPYVRSSLGKRALILCPWSTTLEFTPS